MNTCWVLHLQMSPACFTMASISKQIHCTLVICDFEGVIVALRSTFSISTPVMYLQYYLVDTWLLPYKTVAISVHVLCLPTTRQFTVSLIQSHISRVHVCLDTCHLHVCQCLNLSHTTSVERIPKEKSAPNLDPEERQQQNKQTNKISGRSCGDSHPGSFGHESGALITVLSSLGWRWMETCTSSD